MTRLRLALTLAVAAFALMAATPSLRAQDPPPAVAAEIDAVLLGDFDGIVGSGELRRLLSEIEPERWSLLRRIMFRVYASHESQRAALAEKIEKVETAALAHAAARVSQAPLAALETLARATIDQLAAIEARDPAACVGANGQDAAAYARYALLPREVTLAGDVATLRAARDARAAPTTHLAYDDALEKRISAAFVRLGLSADDVAAFQLEKPPAGQSDVENCRRIARYYATMLRLPEDLRGAVLAFAYRRPAESPDPTGVAADRLARIAAMPDAEIDAMMFAERPERPGAGPILRQVVELDSAGWSAYRDKLRTTFRPIDDEEVATLSEVFAFIEAIGGGLRARLDAAPLAELEGLARLAIESSKAVEAVEPALCGEGAWANLADSYAIYEVLPGEATRFTKASVAAALAARDTPTRRPPFDDAAAERMTAELAKLGFVGEGATGDAAATCRMGQSYYAALLRLPDDVRDGALAYAISGVKAPRRFGRDKAAPQ